MSVVQFPRRPTRAIVVREVKFDCWQAALKIDGELIFTTQRGSLDLVLKAVQWPEVRRGLPIVVRHERKRWVA